MDEGVLHHRASFLGDGANGPFSDSILMMSTDT
jgi:hypothetical protein